MSHHERTQPIDPEHELKDLIASLVPEHGNSDEYQHAVGLAESNTTAYMNNELRHGKIVIGDHDLINSVFTGELSRFTVSHSDITGFAARMIIEDHPFFGRFRYNQRDKGHFLCRAAGVEQLRLMGVAQEESDHDIFYPEKSKHAVWREIAIQERIAKLNELRLGLKKFAPQPSEEF